MINSFSSFLCFLASLFLPFLHSFFSGYYFGIIHKETRTKQHDGLGSEFGVDGIVKKNCGEKIEASCFGEVVKF